MIDLAALRRWLSAELWGAGEPISWTCVQSGEDGEPAVIGRNVDILAVLFGP